MDIIPSELEKAICNNQLLVFVGAGLSYSLLNINGQPIKGWSNLVDQMLMHLKEQNYDVDSLIPLTKKYDPIKVLDLIESDKDIPKTEIYKFIKNFLDINDDNDNLELHKKLYKLSKKIITTNYDTAFEIAVPDLRKHRAYKGKNYELTTHKDPDSTLLFKLHGCFEDADSMVLFPTNYNDLYNNNEKDAEHSLLVLKNIAINKSILFIGTGMGDFQINNIFKEIQNIQGNYSQKHFIISNKQLDSSLSFLTNILVNDYSEIESVIDHLITIKEKSSNTETSEVSALKAQLKEAHKEIERFSSENISDNQGKLLEREAVKYFSRGVEFQLANEFEKAIEKYQTALELKPDFHDALYNWGTYLGHLARTKEDEEAEKLYNQAFDKFKKAIEIKPDFHEALNNWGIYLGDLAKTKEGEEAEKLYNQAFDKFKKVVEIKPDFHEALNNWGTYLGHLAETKEGEEAEKLYNQANDKFKKAVEIKPDFHEALGNSGTCFGHLAETKEGEEAEKLYNQAFDKFKKVIEIKPDDHDALYNWGTYLGNLAKIKEGREAEKLYNQAFDMFKKAVEIKPDDQDTLNNWGSYLGNLAGVKEGEEAEKLYNQAFGKFEMALEKKPDDKGVFYSWGTYLGKLAKTKEDGEAEELYKKAFSKFKKAIELGANSYNLSCIYALRKEKESALKYLKISLSNEEIKVDFVEKDEDWRFYFEDKDFIELLNSYN